MADDKPQMIFPSGLPDCCTTNPDQYKVIAEMPNARLIEMILPPGMQDTPHERESKSFF